MTCFIQWISLLQWFKTMTLSFKAALLFHTMVVLKYTLFPNQETSKRNLFHTIVVYKIPGFKTWLITRGPCIKPCSYFKTITLHQFLLSNHGSEFQTMMMYKVVVCAVWFAQSNNSFICINGARILRAWNEVVVRVIWRAYIHWTFTWFRTWRKI